MRALTSVLLCAGVFFGAVEAWAQDTGARVRLPAGVRATVEVRPEPGQNERVTVTPDGRPPVVAVVSVPRGAVVFVDVVIEADGTWHLRPGPPLANGDGVVFDQRWLTHLPSGRDVWTVVETAAPMVIADHTDNGGLRLGRSARLGSRGTSWSSVTTRVGGSGVLTPDVLGWTPWVVPSIGLDSVTVISGLAPVEFDSAGTHLTAAPRLAGATPRYTFDFSATTPALVERRDLPWAPALARMTGWAAAQGSVSRPLSDRTGLFGAVTLARTTQLEREQPDEWTSRLLAVSTHVNHQSSDNSSVVITGGVQHVVAPYEERRLLRNRHVDERGTFVQLSTAWTRVMAGGVMEWSLGGHRASLTPQVEDTRGGVVDRVLDGRIPSVVWAPTTQGGHVTGSYAVAPVSTGVLTHAVRVGATGSLLQADAAVVSQESFAERVNGVAARIWDPAGSASSSRRTLRHVSGYVADRLAAGRQLTIEAGVRADVWSGKARGASQSVSWTAVSPRVSFQWRVGPWSVFGGSGRYVDRLAPMFLAHGDPAEPVLQVYRWLDVNSNGQVDAAERGALVARQGRGPAVASTDAALRPPRAREHTIGLGLDLSSRLSFRGTATWRRQWDLVGSVNTGVTGADYTTVLIPDAAEDWDGAADDRPLRVYARNPASFGRDSFLLTNPEDATATHEGLEALWVWRSPSLVLNFGATAYRTRSWGAFRGFGPLENDHAAPGEVFETPNARPVVQGSHFFDRSYVGKLSGVYLAPGDVTFAFAARYQDGQPFARIVVVPDLPQGPEMVHAYRVARTRYTYALTLDVRLEKGFSIAGTRGAVRVDVFNATRHLNEVEEDANTSPTFRLSTAMQPPLTARVGLRFDW